MPIRNPESLELLNPGPSQLWVLIDEREDSINDSFFVIDMVGYRDNPARQMLNDVPASYHGGAGALNFADGHAEIRAWIDPRTKPRVTEKSIAQHRGNHPRQPHRRCQPGRGPAARSHRGRFHQEWRRHPC